MLKASDLTQKEVINLTDGKRIGLITDLDVDLKKGKINAVVIPASGRFMGVFSKEHELEISWEQIRKIGEDVILVELKNIVEPSNYSQNENRQFVLEPEFIRRDPKSEEQSK